MRGASRSGEPYGPREDAAGRIELGHAGHHGVGWAWLPLLPLTPLNLAWRKLRGGEEEYFLRVHPGHLHELPSETGDPAAASR